MTSQSEAAASTAANTPTTPTRLKLKRADVIAERAQSTTGPAHLPLYGCARPNVRPQRNQHPVSTFSTTPSVGRSGDAHVRNVPQLQRLERGQNLVAVPDDHCQQPGRIDVLRGDGGDVVLLQGEDCGDEAGEVIVGQIVE